MNSLEKEVMKKIMETSLNNPPIKREAKNGNK